MEHLLEVDLERGPDGSGSFLVTVRSAAGEESGRLQLDPRTVLSQRPQLQATVLASAVTARRAVTDMEAPVRRVGQALFEALFNGHVYAHYKASMALAHQSGTQLHVVLRTQLPDLAALPWEMLYDPEAAAYLCQRDPLVRHVAVSSPTRPLTVAPPLRILGVVSAPSDLQRLDVEGEKRRLTTALAGLGRRVLLTWAPGGRWADVQGELIAESWHVLHFVGHGGFSPERGEGVLVLEDDQGRSDLVGADRFSQLLSLQTPPPQLVLLNSCAGAQAAADDLFSSTAATLVRADVSAVVAMQFAVSDPAAKAFAAGFYQGIAHNHSVADAVRIGRIGIRGTSEETLEWITPALYLRGQDAPLFNVLAPAGGQRDSSSELDPESAAHQAAAEALYQQAMSRFRVGRYADALPLFDSLLSLQPDFRHAAGRREEAATRARAAEAYAEGVDAEERGDWTTAVACYSEVLEREPHRAGVQERLDRCRHESRITDLSDEMRQHLAAEDWEAAAAVAAELERLAPGSSGQATVPTPDPPPADDTGTIRPSAELRDNTGPEPPAAAARPAGGSLGPAAYGDAPALPPRPPDDKGRRDTTSLEEPPRIRKAQGNRRFALWAALGALVIGGAVFAVISSVVDGSQDSGSENGGAEALSKDTLLVTALDGETATVRSVTADGSPGSPVGLGLDLDTVAPGSYARHPTISADRTMVIYLVGAHPGGPSDPKGGSRPRIWSTDGSEEWLFDESDPCVFSTRPAFDPDNERVAVVCWKREDGTDAGLYVVDLDSRDEEAVSLAEGTAEGAPTWTDDGRIVFEVKEAGNFDLWIVDPDVGAPQPLTSGPAMDRAPDWSTEHGLLFVRQPQRGVRDVYVISPDAIDTRNSERPLTKEGTFDSPTWSPDAQWIAFVKTDPSPVLMTMRYDGSERKPIPFDEGEPAKPAWGSR